MSNITAPLPPEAPCPLRVFVVENHADTLTCLLMYLEVRGHRAVAATSLRETLATLPAANCDVLLSDIGLPDGDGLELLRRLQPQLGRPIYAVAMSGLRLPAGLQCSQDAGFRHHLLKPFKVAELDAVLAEAARERPASPAR